MITRILAGREVMPIGLGAMALDEYEPKTEEKDAIELIKYAVESGVNLIDTADVYGLGRNEILIGKALSPEQKDKILITTKAGCTRPGGHAWDTDGRPEHIKEAIQGSLKRLDIKKIWLYQLHAPDNKVPFKESLQAFKELQDQGLIEHIGLSNFSLQQLKEAQEIIKVASVENHFSLDFKTDEQDLLPYLTQQNIAYLTYFPLGSGKILKNQKLIQIAEQLNITASQLALSWILSKWPTAIPIPGTSKKQHLLENIKAADIKLQKDTLEELDNLY